ncbi:hypothetical protein BDF20DRAFT_840087 [Mycotypha africana]|uniref:uncharacterized protein n=1 Tax=Mycotypha africana TaxID=64632 RepID=UPI0023013CBE|nr:uncharacterized protein BDF20DRAFT_840087 [Mycotypha africana]KAI8967534.1 hypothetical protein BDF20DRAFT_840087 [Mycotypha africana]
MHIVILNLVITRSYIVLVFKFGCLIFLFTLTDVALEELDSTHQLSATDCLMYKPRFSFLPSQMLEREKVAQMDDTFSISIHIAYNTPCFRIKDYESLYEHWSSLRS